MLGDTRQQKRADSAAYRRSHHVDRSPKRFRLAGEVFGIEEKNNPDRPSGKFREVGFADKDKYGPDNDWKTREVINSTLGPVDYSDY